MRKSVPPPPKGIRSVRHTIGAILWDTAIERSGYSNLSELVAISKFVATLPGGDEARWFFETQGTLNTILDSRRGFEKFVSEVQAGKVDWRISDPLILGRVLYYCFKMVNEPAARGPDWRPYCLQR